MITESQNNFEDEWRKAFESSELTPPTDMWNRIERELDKKEKRPFLFFIRPNLSAGIAATLILTLAGFWYFSNSSTPKQNIIAQKQSSNSHSQTKKVLESKPNQEESITRVDIPNKLEIATSNEIKTVNRFGSSKPNSTNKIKDIPNYSEKGISVSSVAVVNPEIIISENRQLVAKNDKELAKISTKNIENQFTSEENKSVVLEKIRNKGFHLFVREFYLNRNKLLFENENNFEPKDVIAQNSQGKFWLGIQSGVAPFKPSMDLNPLNSISLREAEIFADYSNNLVQSGQSGNTPIVGAGNNKGTILVTQPQNNLKNGISTHVGFNWGYQLNNKFSLESGLKYLRGNSILESNTYSFAENGEANTFFANYLSNNASGDFRNTIIADASQGVSRYEYIMLPIQVGYQVNLSKKIGLQLSSGVTADIFLQNTIINDNGMLQDKSIIKRNNSLYKPLNFSSLQGLRGLYQINNRWQAVISGTYQQSLSSNTTSDVLKMKLKIFGLSYGLNYRF